MTRYSSSATLRGIRVSQTIHLLKSMVCDFTLAFLCADLTVFLLARYVFSIPSHVT